MSYTQHANASHLPHHHSRNQQHHYPGPSRLRGERAARNYSQDMQDRHHYKEDLYEDAGAVQTLGTMITEKDEFPRASEYDNMYNAQKLGKPGIGLEFWDLSYAVTKEVKKEGKWIKKQVNLLSEISGQALKGQVTAVLGPSGAGKSTFLDALAGRIAKGSLQGSVSVDGQQITTSHMKKISSYVMQDDQLFPMLTVLETFMFAAEVRLPPSMSKSQKKDRVYQLLEQLGLQSATHTYIGDEGTRGVSGGERRRVSIGVDIIHGPPLLFLDEPTSGLDSTSAFTVVDRLKDIAKSGSIVLMTIHQPSYRIQELLSTMIILARGRLIYLGPPPELEKYLAEFGRELPEGENSIEYLLDVIKEYDESTLGLDPLVQYQRYGIRPTEAMKTPVRRTPRNKMRVDAQQYGVPTSTAPSGAVTAAAAHQYVHGAEVTGNNMQYMDGMNYSYSYEGYIGEEDEANFDNSLVRRTPLNNFRDPNLASSFYKNFSVWLYNEVVESVRGTPGPPTWLPPQASTVTPGRTPNMPAGGPTPAHHYQYFQHSYNMYPPAAPTATSNAAAVPNINRANITHSSTTDHQQAALYTPSEYADSDLAISGHGGPKFANPWLREVRVLMWRNVLNITRTPELFLSREIVFIVMSLMLSSLFKHLKREFHIDVANNLLNFFIFAVSLLFFSSNDAVPAFIQERYIYIRETSHNAYRASSYTIANLIVLLPFFAIQALTFTLLTFFLLKLQGHWWVFWLILYASLITTNSYVVFISAIVPNYITGYAMVIASTAIFFLNCGFFLKRSKIPKYWIWLHYMSTIKYPFEALLINQFHVPHDRQFCYSATDEPAVGALGHVEQATNVSHPAGCYAVGEDILWTMDIKHKSILLDLAILLAWGVFYRLLFYVILRFYSKNQRK